MKAVDSAASLKQDKEFHSQLKAISKQLTNFQSTFTASLSDFLMALSLVSDYMIFYNILLQVDALLEIAQDARYRFRREQKQ